MGNRLEAFNRLSASALGWTVLGGQFRVFGLDLFQLIEELVKLAIRNLWFGVGVIPFVVVVDEAAQLFGAVLERCHGTFLRGPLSGRPRAFGRRNCRGDFGLGAVLLQAP